MGLPTGPHRRYDPLADRWVLVSTGRTQRPWLGRKEAPADVAERPAYDPGCYLCPGNTRANGSQNPDYGDTFVFTNDYAALQPDVGDGHLHDGLLIAESERGTCRVVCFSPRHDLALIDMAEPDVRRVIDLWAQQTTELGAEYRWIQIFENRGEAMGASNPHPHGQIWAGSALPEHGKSEEASQQRHHRETGHRLLLDVVEQEAGGVRVIFENAGWLALVPFWAMWPYEAMLIPRRPAARLSDLDDQQRDDLAMALQQLMGRYDALFDQPMPLSMGWHQAPFDDSPSDHWQLHAHFLPPLLEATKRKFMVGYELLSEPQRDISPETAAERLRAATPSNPARLPIMAGADSGDG
jgi:UDPglucose--hexose-1-phosphate uridylyltransferase